MNGDYIQTVLSVEEYVVYRRTLLRELADATPLDRAHAHHRAVRAMLRHRWEHTGS